MIFMSTISRLPELALAPAPTPQRVQCRPAEFRHAWHGWGLDCRLFALLSVAWLLANAIDVTDPIASGMANDTLTSGFVT